MSNPTSIFKAIQAADLATLRELIAAGRDVNERDARQSTPLIQAAALGNVEAVDLLLQAGATVDAQNEDTQTALMEACWHDRADVVARLLDAGADVSLENDLALDFAVRQGGAAIVRMLLDAGADASRCDEESGTTLLAEAIQRNADDIISLLQTEVLSDAKEEEKEKKRRKGKKKRKKQKEKKASKENSALVNAAYYGRLDLVRDLLGRGAPVNGRFEGNTPLIAAAMQKHEHVIKVLLAAGADVNARNNIGGMTSLLWAVERSTVSMARLLIEAGANVECTDEYGNTPLLLAAQQKKCELVKLLALSGANINALDEQGWNPLRNAVWGGKTAEKIKTLRTLIECGADVNLVGAQGMTPLIQAIASQDYEVASELLQSGADSNRRLTGKPFHDLSFGKGATALMIASDVGHLPTVKKLVEAGAVVNEQDGRGRTALSLAAKSGHTAVVEFLKSIGAKGSVNGKKFQAAAVQQAASAGDLNALNQALEAGGDPNRTNKSGEPPLVVAARNGRCDLIQALLANGADVNGAAKHSRTPLREAVVRRHSEIVAELIAAGADVNRRFQPCSLPAEKNTVYISDETVLADAAMYGYAEIVESLVAAGADLDLRNSQGFSPLALAAANRHWEVAQLLLNSGATPDGVASDYLHALDYPKKADSDEFRQSVRDMEELCGVEGQPIGWLPGAVSFKITVQREADELVRSKRAVNEIAAEIQAMTTKVDYILEQAQDRLAQRKCLAFDAGYPLGCGDGKFLVLVPTDDQFAVIAAIGTSGNEQALSNQDILKWLRRLNQQQPFDLRECRFDTVGIEFHEVVHDPESLAKRMSEFNHDLIDQGFESLDSLVAHLRKSRRITFWWD